MSRKLTWQQCDIQNCGVRQPHNVFVIHTMICGGILFEVLPVPLLTDISKYPKSIWEYWVYKQANKSPRRYK